MSMRGLVILLSGWCIGAGSMAAAIRYVDPTATGANNGTSWADAWTSLAFSGLAAGDTVYISGGPDGETHTYTLTADFSSLAGFRQGTAGNPVTYQIGQDSAHNGTAIFTKASRSGHLLFGVSNIIFSGDAGDGNKHFRVTNYVDVATLNDQANVRLAYLDCPDVSNFGSINHCAGIEVGHCYIYVSVAGADRAIYANILGTGYADSSFHHNTIYVPYTTGGVGADCFQIVGSGYSIHHNTVIGYSGGGVNHQDGWQAGGGSYIEIYGNLFVDMQNYAVFAEPANGSYTHVRIYNNIAVDTSGAGSQAFALGARKASGFLMTDVICANNIAVGYTLPFTFRDAFAVAGDGTFFDCLFANNVAVGGANVISSEVQQESNVVLTAEQAAAMFAAFTVGAADNDYHLTEAATSLIGQGTDLSAFGLTADAEGNAWNIPPDVGAYRYAAAVGPTVAAAPASQTVSVGTNVVLSVGPAGTPPFTYQWQKDGEAIAGATAATLTVSAAQLADAGDYTVVVTNASGSVTSDAATLTVNAPVVIATGKTAPQARTLFIP